jgi:hypothetical protein
MYSTTASSSCERVRHTRSAMSSVLKLSTKLSATALMLLICAGSQRQAERSMGWALGRRGGA